MAMTVRLPDELDERLEQLARERHVSKHAVIVEATARFVASEGKTARVLAAVDDITERYGEALDRLRDA